MTVQIIYSEDDSRKSTDDDDNSDDVMNDHEITIRYNWNTKM